MVKQASNVRKRLRRFLTADPGRFAGGSAVSDPLGLLAVERERLAVSAADMGTGEVTRYLGRYGSARVAKGVLVAPIPPYLLQAADNPEGVPQGLFDGFAQAATADTPAWMKGFLDNFYNIDTLRGTLVSDQAWQASWNLAVTASATAAVACIADLDDRLPRRPAQDRRADAGRPGRRGPGPAAGQDRPAAARPDQGRAARSSIEGGPHAIPWTHAAQVNTALLDFIRS